MRIVTSSSAALGGMGAKLRSVMCGAGSMSDNGGHRSGDASHSSGFCSGSWMMAAVEQQRQLHHQLLAAAADSDGGSGQREDQTSSPHQMGLLKGEYSDYSDSDSD